MIKKVLLNNLAALQLDLANDDDAFSREELIANLVAILHVYANDEDLAGRMSAHRMATLYDEAYAKYRAEFAKVVKSDV